MTQFAGVVCRVDDQPRIPESLTGESSPPTVRIATAPACCPSGAKLVMFRHQGCHIFHEVMTLTVCEKQPYVAQFPFLICS